MMSEGVDSCEMLQRKDSFNYCKSFFRNPCQCLTDLIYFAFVLKSWYSKCSVFLTMDG